jgi:hypothetical protein
MPQLEVVKREDVRIRVKKLDSTGRTREQAEAMEQNAFRTPKLGDNDKAFADLIAEEQNVYPKVMYRLALKNGLPVGDEISPSYPMPFDLANQVGIKTENYKLIGKTRESPGNLVLRHPYQSLSCGVIKDDQSIDLPASKKQEAELRTAGWVDRIEDIKGLPKLAVDDPYAPLPAEGGTKR